MIIKLIPLGASVFVFVFIAIFSPLFEINEVTFINDQKCLQNEQDFASKEFIGENSRDRS